MNLPPGVTKSGIFWISVVLIAIAILVSIITVAISTKRPLTGLEGTLLQFLSLATGLAGSYVFGKLSSEGAARELIKPAARSAFRRVVWLYGSLTRLGQTLSGEDNAADRVRVAGAIVAEQLSAASDSMEDWRDLVPDEVADVERRLGMRNKIDTPEKSNDR